MPLIDNIAKAATNAFGGYPILGDFVDLPKPKPFLEYGASGLLRTRGTGYVYEEWLPSLSGQRAREIYREMRDNDAVVGALFFALEMILRRADCTVHAAPGAKGRQYGEYVEQCMEDMSHTWPDFISEVVNMFAFGFSIFETVYKRRQGPQSTKASSKFNDGLIGWRKFAPRAQETIDYWTWDEQGGLQAAIQRAAPEYNLVPLPISKLLLFRTTSVKNNPEGRSVLRNAVRSWLFKRRIEEVEGIGIERDLCGMPVLSLGQEALAEMGGADAAKKLVTGVRRDESMGLVLPLAYDSEGNPQVKFELLRAAGQRQADPGATIARYNSDILNSMLAGFIEFGQGDTGSRALHTSAKGIFYNAIAASLEGVAGVMNRYAIPRLMALNRMDLEFAPKLVFGEVGERDLSELGAYVQQLAMAGLTFFDEQTANYLRKRAGLPDAPEGDEGGPPQQQQPAPAAQPRGKAPKPGAPGQQSQDRMQEAA
jgi:hypothetical protein